MVARQVEEGEIISATAGTAEGATDCTTDATGWCLLVPVGK